TGATGSQGPAGATGPTGAIGPTGPQGPAAPSVITEVVTTTSTLPMAAGMTRIHDIACPASKIATGGGFEVPASARVLASRPYTASTWRVVVTATETSNVTV